MGQLFWQLTAGISEERMTEALTRILGLKAAKGLHKNRLETQSDEALAEALQNPEYKKIAPAISDFTKDNDLVISLLDVANGHPAFGLSKGGGEIPWYVHELPVVGISVNKPTVLADVPMLRTFINTYGAVKSQRKHWQNWDIPISKNSVASSIGLMRWNDGW